MTPDSTVGGLHVDHDGDQVIIHADLPTLAQLCHVWENHVAAPGSTFGTVVAGADGHVTIHASAADARRLASGWEYAFSSYTHSGMWRPLFLGECSDLKRCAAYADPTWPGVVTPASGFRLIVLDTASETVTTA